MKVNLQIFERHLIRPISTIDITFFFPYFILALFNIESEGFLLNYFGKKILM